MSATTEKEPFKAVGKAPCCSVPPGICLILGLALDEADQHADGSALGDTARNVVRNFERYRDSFTVASDPFNEMNHYIAIGLDLSRGRRTRKETKRLMYQNADHELRTEHDRIVNKALMGGMLKGGFKIIVLSGVGAMLTPLIFTVFGLNQQRERGAIDPQLASAAVAISLIFFGMVWQSALTNIRVSKLFRDHRNEIKKADEQYRADVRIEYRRAAQAEIATRRYYHPEEELSLTRDIQDLLIYAEMARATDLSDDLMEPEGWGQVAVRVMAPWRAMRLALRDGPSTNGEEVVKESRAAAENRIADRL